MTFEDIILLSESRFNDVSFVELMSLILEEKIIILIEVPAQYTHMHNKLHYMYKSV